MPSKYNPGDIAFIVESSRFIRKVIIIKVSGDLYSLRFTDSKGGVKLRENRLYQTQEEAQKSIKPVSGYKYR